jgi:hypothetical protein
MGLSCTEGRTHLKFRSQHNRGEKGGRMIQRPSKNDSLSHLVRPELPSIQNCIAEATICMAAN